MHEAQLHEHNCFITLTYAENPITLVYRDFQLFMKRLRKVKGKVRFFVCGEYGEIGARPHFHACLFGCRFEDRRLFSSRNGIRLYDSPLLSRLWPFGFASIGDVTFQSAAYVARYIMKKVTGDEAEAHYLVVNPDTGELVNRVPEFSHCSLKPGIGSGWFDKFAADIYPSGEVVVNGVKCAPPKYYDRKYAELDSDGFARVAFEREMRARLRVADNTVERLAVKETVAKARMRFLKRSI